MRWGLLGVRIAIALFNLAIVVIILLAIFPLITGGLDIDIPETSEAGWSLDGDTLRLSTSFSVRNGGFYDIEDLSLGFVLTDEEGDVLLTDRSDPADMPAAETTTVDIELALDIGSMSQSAKRKVVFEGGTYGLTVDLETYYIMKLMKLNVSMDQQMDLQPLISDYVIDENNIQYQYVGSQLLITIPYHVSASDIIAGSTIDVDCTMTNSTATLGNGSETVVLSQYTTGDFTILLSEGATSYLATHSDTLTITLELDFMNARAEQTLQYQWVAPGP